MNPQEAISFAPMVEAQLAYLRAHRFGHLRFPAALEQRFEARTRAARARRLWIETWILAACFWLVLLGDYEALPARFAFALSVRIGLALPCFLLATEILRRNPRRWLRESVLLLAAGVAAASSFLVYRDASATISLFPQLTMLLALLACNVVLRVRFRFAAAATFFCILTNALFLATDARLSVGEKFGCGGPILCACLFILFAAYTLEHEERHSWLLQRHTETQAHRLAELNTELARLSALDPLTGLANRAAFDQRFDTLWQQAVHGRTPLSAILLDVDHFKVVNDTQGHLYGDEVLKRVAALVQQALRGAEDFAARFGGEEFIILLPETTAQSAMLIAERVRTLVQIAGSPAPRHAVPQPGLWTTVSCGVSTVTDTAGHHPRELIHAADTALYAAKADGRNCTRFADLHSLTPDASPQD